MSLSTPRLQPKWFKTKFKIRIIFVYGLSFQSTLSVFFPKNVIVTSKHVLLFHLEKNVFVSVTRTCVIMEYFIKRLMFLKLIGHP